MLARARDRCKSARRRKGCDGDRIDARYRIADDRGPQGRWADVREPGGTFCAAYSSKWGVADEMALPIESIAINYIAISIIYEFAVLF
jgi:hypothetical protein